MIAFCPCLLRILPYGLTQPPSSKSPEDKQNPTLMTSNPRTSS